MPSAPSSPGARFPAVALRLAATGALLALAMGSVFLFGYLAQRPDLKSVLQELAPMKPNTALCFVLSGLALLCLVAADIVPRATHAAALRPLRAGVLLAALPPCIGLATLAQYAFGVDFAIDAMLVRLGNDAAAQTSAFRMAPESALCHTLLGIALLLDTRRRRSRPAVLFAAFFCLVIVAIAAASLGAYFSPLFGLFGWVGLPIMAADSAVLFIVLGIAALLVASTQQAFRWELGKRATTGFIGGMVVLIVIFLTATRTQYQISAIDAQMARQEALNAKSADTLALASQQHSLILGYLATDDMNMLNAALINGDTIRPRLAELDVRAAPRTEADLWRYQPIVTRTQDILTWSATTLASHRKGLPPAGLQETIRLGNTLLARLKLSFDQAESEHRHAVSELRYRSGVVRSAAFITTCVGLVANLVVFTIVLLNINRLVSERHRVKTELIESEQQYRTLADSGQALIWTAGTDKRCNYFNSIWLAFTGRTLAQEVGDGWTEGVHPDDLAQCVDTYVQAFDRREKFSMDYRLRRHDGEYRWIQDDGCPRYDAQGTFIGYIGYCLDITDRKLATAALQESELRFRRLFGDIPSVAVQGYGPDLVTHYWNRASEQLYGYRADEAIGRRLTDLIIPPEMRENVREAVNRMMATGQPLATDELSLLRKDGSRISVISSHAVVSVPDKPPELFCVDIDISERKRIEAELEQYRDHLEALVEERTAELADARDAAEAANRAKSSFLANMSHEIRTPMNAIIGFAHLLRRDLGEVPAQAKIARIMEAAQHLLGIINNILDLSKIEAGQLSLEETEFSPETLVTNTLTMISDRANAKGLRIVAAIHPGVPARMLGDSLRVSQILINYLSNAIKFSERGEIHVRLLVEREDAHGALFRLEVQDQGIGLSPAQQAQIFQAFVQADGSTTRRFGGTGLGLVISRHLAHSMGGEVGVQSLLGAGSLFWATLRLKRPLQAGTAAAADGSARHAEDLLRERFGGLTVLLAEDDPTSREIAVDLLSVAGLVVDTADNGIEAVRMASQRAYPLIVMDMQMPGMGGVDAARTIRSQPGPSRDAVILALTANAFEENRRECFEAGMNDHLSKPFSAELLYATIVHWLDRAAREPAPLPPAEALPEKR